MPLQTVKRPDRIGTLTTFFSWSIGVYIYIYIYIYIYTHTNIYIYKYAISTHLQNK